MPLGRICSSQPWKALLPIEVRTRDTPAGGRLEWVEGCSALTTSPFSAVRCGAREVRRDLQFEP